MDQQTAWNELRDQTLETLGEGAVFGEGPLDAGLAVIGEAPGRQEAERGHPFVGQAGKLLDGLFKEAGVDRSQVYMTNTVKFRPTIEKNGRLSNRPPRAAEVREGVETLLSELEIVAPRALVLLGTTPAKALISRSFTMGSGRGVWYASGANVPALATYHPAYLLRQTGEALDRARELVIEDLKVAREALDKPPEARQFDR